MNIPTTTVVDAEPSDGLTREQRQAKERARAFFRRRDQLAEEQALAAVRAAERRLPDQPAASIIYAALVEVCKSTVDTSRLLPAQESEKGKG